MGVVWILLLPPQQVDYLSDRQGGIRTQKGEQRGTRATRIVAQRFHRPLPVAQGVVDPVVDPVVGSPPAVSVGEPQPSSSAPRQGGRQQWSVRQG